MSAFEFTVGLLAFISGLGFLVALFFGFVLAVEEGPAYVLERIASWPSRWRLLREERALAEAKRRSEIRQELARLQAEEHREALRQLEGR